MTRPKKWYLDGAEEEDGIVLRTSDGLAKKPNANSPLGVILMVSVASEEERGKFSQDEAVYVSYSYSYSPCMSRVAAYIASCTYTYVYSYSYHVSLSLYKISHKLN